ncbi:hypothetical protein LINPERPRIM_LOCUS33756, partial [Linum perenne]
FEPYLARIGLDQLTNCLNFTPDFELITALVERWHPRPARSTCTTVRRPSHWRACTFSPA